LLNRFDWWGLLSMAGFLGAAEYVLEEGPRKGWFDEDAILMLAVLSVGCAIAFFARSLMAKNPIVDLRAFTNRNFAVGSLFSFVLGIGLYGLTYLYPVYLAQVRGYNALMIGETMFVSGVAMFMTAPVVGQLTQRVDPRYILITGFLLFAIGTWQMTGLTKDWDFYELLWPQIFRGVGLMAAMVPVTNTALGTLDPARLKNASGLFNLTRNLGGAIGLAVINTLLNDRMDLHLVRLHEAVNGASVAATETLDQLTQKFGGSDGALQALKQVSMMVRQQALVMSFADVFWMLTVMFVMLAAMGIFMRKPQAAGGGGGGH
jgi:DHA2 family multidrug resistance protein